MHKVLPCMQCLIYQCTSQYVIPCLWSVWYRFANGPVISEHTSQGSYLQGDREELFHRKHIYGLRDGVMFVYDVFKSESKFGQFINSRLNCISWCEFAYCFSSISPMIICFIELGCGQRHLALLPRTCASVNNPVP